MRLTELWLQHAGEYVNDMTYGLITDEIGGMREGLFLIDPDLYLDVADCRVVEMMLDITGNLDSCA